MNKNATYLTPTITLKKGALLAYTGPGRLVKTGNPEHDARYNTYAKWDFVWGCGFLRVPIGEWRWKPYFGWAGQVVGFSWLFFTLKWNKSFHYVERKDWQIQQEMDTITNQRIDNIKMSIW